ncbi:hypothetical protein PG989_007175 [Apiospora arundinis]
MPPGPFDSRIKRSRCKACSASHLKCDNGRPCSHCKRRGSPCTYTSSTQKTIRLEQAKHKTLESFSSKNRDVKRLQHDQLIMQSRFGPVLSSGPTDRYLYYFEAFVQRNVFVPNMSSYNIDIRTLFGTTSGQFLRQAVVSLGALQASRVSADSRSSRKEDEYAALEAYSTSLLELRETMASCASPPRLLVLWTTLFLGIFELMHGETGDGWLMHMVHGTANALQAAGPQACKSGLGRSFFLQARIFEASRALLLGENTFLSDPGWEGLTETDQAADGSSNRSCLDIMLSIIVQCSRLRAQYVTPFTISYFGISGHWSLL